MAEPSAAQKRMLAKMGLAMPDGSYYIRNGAVGASDLSNAIKAVGRGGADHDDIRKHIIKRANALELEKEIPDTWNSDGSLKQPAAAQSAVELGEEFIAHFGRKGMKWGAHIFGGGSGSGSTPNKPSKADQLNAKATEHERRAAAHVLIANEHLKANKDLETHGVHSKAFASYYGEHAALQNPGLFQLANGRNKAQAVGELSELHRGLHNSNVRAANRHSKKAAKLRIRAKEAVHSDIEDDLEDTLEDVLDEALIHFGRKGMKWGSHVFTGGGSSGSTPNQHASADAQRALHTAHTIQKHGVHAVSNPDLQHLVTRLNLEKQHGNLTVGPNHSKVVTDLLKSAGKQQAQSLVNQYAAKGAEHAAKHLTKAIVGSGRHAH